MVMTETKKMMKETQNLGLLGQAERRERERDAYDSKMPRAELRPAHMVVSLIGQCASQFLVSVLRSVV